MSRISSAMTFTLSFSLFASGKQVYTHDFPGKQTNKEKHYK